MEGPGCHFGALLRSQEETPSFSSRQSQRACGWWRDGHFPERFAGFASQPLPKLLQIRTGQLSSVAVALIPARGLQYALGFNVISECKKRRSSLIKGGKMSRRVSERSHYRF